MDPAELESMRSSMMGGGMGGGGGGGGAMSSGGGGGGGGAGGMPGMPAGMDPAAMMADMKPEQIKNMLGMLKKNPGMMKSMLKSNPMFASLDEGAIDKQLDMLSGIDDDKLEMMIGAGQKLMKSV